MLNSDKTELYTYLFRKKMVTIFCHKSHTFVCHHLWSPLMRLSTN